MGYLRKPSADKQWLSLTTRLAMENYDSYDDAIGFVKDTSFIGPCYVIIGGVKENEGAVLSIGPDKTLYDDRRYPAEDCMDEIGAKGMDWSTLYNVLNGI